VNGLLGVAYVYAPDRKADRPIAHLAGFKGILQVDGYASWPNVAMSSLHSAGRTWGATNCCPSSPPRAGEALKHIANGGSAQSSR
jgi:transposase